MEETLLLSTLKVNIYTFLIKLFSLQSFRAIASVCEEQNLFFEAVHA